MYKIILCLLLLSCQCHAQTCIWSPTPQACKPLPLIPSNYEIIDLGETSIAPDCLDRFSTPQTYAPRINQVGAIAYNIDDQSIIQQDGVGEISLNKTFGPTQCFGINDMGDLLLAFNRSSENVNWMIWKTQAMRKTGEIPIFGEKILGSHIYLRALNNQGIAVGSFRPEGKLRPLFWSPSKGLHHLGYFFGWDLEGVLWNVNDQGTVVGTVYPSNCDPQIFIPFVWNEKWGLERLTDYRTLLSSQLHRSLKDAAIQFCNPVIDHDDIVYGQIYIDEYIYHYMWYPRSHEIRLRKLGNLKLNAVNNNYIFAGSLEGEAALYQRYLEPVVLSTLIAELPEGWKLIEVSDINDAGAVVGFGTFKGATHLFHAIPSSLTEKIESSPVKPVEAKPGPKQPLLKVIFGEDIPQQKEQVKPPINEPVLKTIFELPQPKEEAEPQTIINESLKTIILEEALPDSKGDS